MINSEEQQEAPEKEPEQPVEDIPSLKEALGEEKSKTLQYLYNWQRAQADLLNYKKTSDKDRQEAVKYGNAALMLSLLPVLDDLQRAVDSLPPEANAGWTQGIKMIQRKLLSTLQSQGLTPIEAVEQTFDPFIHEAVGFQEGEENKVLAEAEKGYKFQDRVLRPARVILGKSKESSQ